jgi:hypothetical protein
MKRALCIKYEFDEFFELTLDKWYDVVSEDDEFFYLFSDLNYTQYFVKKNFLTEQQIRKKKLEKINENSR